MLTFCGALDPAEGNGETYAGYSQTEPARFKRLLLCGPGTGAIVPWAWESHTGGSPPGPLTPDPPGPPTPDPPGPPTPDPPGPPTPDPPGPPTPQDPRPQTPQDPRPQTPQDPGCTLSSPGPGGAVAV
ncbi:unnamed protein product [Arctogadus glacialis]